MKCRLLVELITGSRGFILPIFIMLLIDFYYVKFIFVITLTKPVL